MAGNRYLKIAGLASYPAFSARGGLGVRAFPCGAFAAGGGLVLG